MESQRIGDKVKKITLLNLGSDFSIDQEHWANLSKRIEDIINKTPSLFELDKDLESLAQQYAARLVLLKAKKQNSTMQEDNNRYKEIDTTSVDNSDSKDIGCEHIIYETIKELELDTKLKELGFTNVQLNSAIGTIVAKMINPSSDIKTYRWLCNKSGINELIDCDFNKISSSNIYRVADKLYKNTIANLLLYSLSKDTNILLAENSRKIEKKDSQIILDAKNINTDLLSLLDKAYAEFRDTKETKKDDFILAYVLK